MVGDLIVDSLVLDGGIFDINDDKLTILSDLSTNNTFGASLMVQTNGNASDGGLELLIDALDTYDFPVGTNKNSVTRYTPATVQLNTFNDDGYISISPTDIELATLNIGGTNALSFYWAVKGRDFSTNPDITAIDFTYDNSDTHTGLQLVTADNYVPGKVESFIPFTRTGLTTVINATNTFSYDGGGSPFTFANENYTAGTPNKFTGTVRVFYCRADNEGDNWNTASNWSTVGPDSPTNSFSTYPQAGDVAVISYSATQTGVAKRRRIRVNAGTVATVAELILEQNPAAGLVENENSRLVIPDNPGTGLTVAGTVSGDGEIQYRMRGSYQPVLSFGDLGPFVKNENASWIMRADDANDIVVPEITDTYPRLSIVGDGGSQDNSIIFDHDITCRNMNIRFAGTLRMNDGPEGDITILDSLRLGTIGGEWSGDLMFQNSGTGRTLTVGGNIIIDSDDPPNAAAGPADFFVETGGSTNVIHQVNVGGSIIIRDDASRDGTFDLFTDNTGGANAILRFYGTSSGILTNNTSNTPDLYRIIMDKGSDTTATFTIQDYVVLNASNNADPQSIELLAGKLIIDDPLIDVELADGVEFVMPSGTGLEVTQGTITAQNDASINLDGLLRVNGGTVTLNDSDIIYSNTGEALIDVSAGSLTVGNQLRRPITTSSGILKYRQSGGTVLIGADGQSENGRAMFEVLNPGSEFTLSPSASFTIQRGVTGDDNPSLELDPDTYDITGSTIVLGNSSTPSVTNSNFFNVKTAIPLENLTLFGDADFPIVRAFSLPITTNGTFEIQANADFQANGFDITINGDIDNEGTYTNATALTTFSSGTSQDLSGAGTYTFFDLTKDNTGTLNVQSDITINNDLRVEQGTMALGTSIAELKGDAYIESIVTNSTGGGYLSFNSDFNNQNLYGLANNTITMGKIQIDNPLGVDITDGFGYNFDITEELALLEGVFNVGGSLVTIKEGGVITGDAGGTAQSDFSINNMVQTNSSFVDNGLKIEYFTLGMDSTLFFPVGEQKYTPVAFNLLEDSEGGSIRVRPANEYHPTIVNNIEPPEDFDDFVPPGPLPAGSEIIDTENVLQYYWIVVADDIDVTGIEGSAEFFYNPEDISINNDFDDDAVDETSFTVADYISARLLSNGTQWDKFAPVDFDEASNKFTVPLGAGIENAGITGDYTAGVGNSGNNTNATSTNIEGAIPDEIVEYISQGDASYGDDSNWSPNPGTGIGPVGGRITISAGDEVTVDLNGIRLYETIIEEGAILILNGANFGHRLGNVRGQGTIQLQNSGDLPAGEYSEFFDCDGGALEYAGSGNYNVLGSISEIRKVSFLGTDQRIMPNNILEVCDTLRVNGPTLQLNTGQTITIGDVATPNDLFWVESGTVSLSNSTLLDVNGSVDFEGGSFTGSSGTTMRIYENLTRTATAVNWNNTAVTFDGATAQVITGDLQGTRAFDNITINNTSSTGITIIGDVDVDGQLTFTNGHFYTNSTSGNTLRLTTSGTYTGASSSSHVKGPLTKNNVPVSSSYTFPVGKSSRYAPITVIDPTTGGDNWTAEYFTTNLRGTGSFDPTDPGSGYGALTEISNDMWRVESAGANSAKIRLTYGSWHATSDQNDLRVAWWDTGQTRWENQGGNPITGNLTTGTIDSENPIAFSSQDFTLGATSDDALPVEMLYILAQEDDGRVFVEWATASEENNDYFEVQRSIDGRDWEVIGNVEGAGTTTIKQTYSFLDRNPYVGLSYYRLRQIDFDGKFAFTNVALANVKLEPLSANIYPNPVIDWFNFDIKGVSAFETVNYKIINLQGGIIDSGSIQASESGRIEGQMSFSYGQPAGVYLFLLETKNRMLKHTIIKKQ